MIDWWFRNRQTGEITIAQAPNLPILIFVAAWVLRWLLDPTGSALRALDLIATVAILWWAVDEVVRGVNPWRRLLGAVVLFVIVVGWLR